MTWCGPPSAPRAGSATWNVFATHLSCLVVALLGSFLCQRDLLLRVTPCLAPILINYILYFWIADAPGGALLLTGKELASVWVVRRAGAGINSLVTVSLPLRWPSTSLPCWPPLSCFYNKLCPGLGGKEKGKRKKKDKEKRSSECVQGRRCPQRSRRGIFLFHCSNSFLFETRP